MARGGLILLALYGAGAGTALAQDTGLVVSVGARAWYAEWTTFSYFTEKDAVTQKFVNKALIQVSASDKLTLMPVISLRYGDFSGSISALPSTRFQFVNGDSGTRREFDANLGYSVIPGLALTLGYKKVSQRDNQFRYEPAGVVVGASANAPLAGAFAMYGSFGLGRLKTRSSSDPNVVQFKADYRLTELGLAYGITTGGLPRRWTFTAGYRIQVMSSKQAFGDQDGRDTTQGLTVGAVATF